MKSATLDAPAKRSCNAKPLEIAKRYENSLGMQVRSFSLKLERLMEHPAFPKPAAERGDMEKIDEFFGKLPELLTARPGVDIGEQITAAKAMNEGGYFADHLQIAKAYSHATCISLRAFKAKVRRMLKMSDFPEPVPGLGYPKAEVRDFFKRHPDLFLDKRGRQVGWRKNGQHSQEARKLEEMDPFEKSLAECISLHCTGENGIDSGKLTRRLAALFSGKRHFRKIFTGFVEKYDMELEIADAGKSVFAGFGIQETERIFGAVRAALMM